MTTTYAPSRRLTAIATACALWMASFAVMHAYWAFGGGFALPDGFHVPDVPLLLIIDIVAIPLCMAGAALAVALLGSMPRVRARRLLFAVVSVAGFCIVHSAVTVVDDIGMLFGLVHVPTDVKDRFSMFVYEPWWLSGGVLFALAAVAVRGRCQVRHG